MIPNYENYYEIVEKLNDIFKDIDKYRAIYEIDREQAEEEIKLYSQLKDRAALGEKAARNYLINQYTKILSVTMDFSDEKNISKLIDYENIQNNGVIIIFEMLLDLYDISYLIDHYGLKIRVSEKEIRNIAKLEEEKLLERFYGNTPKIRLIATIIYSRGYGQDCIDTLQHHNISEIGIIDRNYIYIVYKGDKLYLEFLSIVNKNVILNIQKKTTQNSPVNFDEQNPTLVTAKNNSSRITVAGYDATPTDEDLYYNERIFNLQKITLEEMRDTYNTISQGIYSFLAMNQQGRGSHFVTGSDMGIGKSTFLLAMMEKVPDHWGIGILDTQNELQARKKYPWKNILTLIENPKRSIAQCFEIMLKMARDIIIVGEITKPSEVGEMINASLRLNAGVGGTLHSLSPYEVVTNVRNLMMLTGIYKDSEVAEADIARGLDIIIHLAKLPGGRIVVDNVVEVEYLEHDLLIQPVLEGSNREKLSNLLNLAQLALQKYMYRRSYRYNEIFRYDRENDNWLAINLPSESYFNKISKYVPISEISKYKQQFLELKEVGL
ncbi:MAG: putative type secretion system protein [Clostridiales bacterium]|nr:putative type secretion system protein [Clostridiales bacterium]